MKERWPFRRRLPPGRPGDEEDQIRAEIEHYLELRTEELMAEGRSAEEARAEAERRFGDPEAIARRMGRRAQNQGTGRRTMGRIWHDVRHALRGFRRSPGFTAVAVLTLAVALAGNSALFSVLDEAVLQALPFPDHDRLVFVRGYHDTDGQRAYRMASIPEFMDWRAGSRSFTGMAAVDGTSVTLGGADRPERLQAEAVSGGYFELLGADAALGRTFTLAEAETPDAASLVVLSHDLWQRRFAGDGDVLGRRVQVDGVAYSVLGVMPPEFQPVGLDGVDLWLPLAAYGAGAFEARGGRFLPVVARLATGFTVEEAQADLDAIAGDLQAAHPEAHEDRWGEVIPFREGYLGTTGDLLWVLFGAGVLLLLIAAANVANLLLVRAHRRTREITVRRALGAGGGRVASQLMVESLVLAALGGLVGLILAAWGLSALLPLVPAGVLPAYVDPGISGRVFMGTLAILAVVGVTAGLLPAWSCARRDLASTLRAGGRGSTAGGRRTRQAFVIAQVALAILVLVGAGLLTRSFRAQLAVNPGLEMDGIQVFRVQPPAERYPDGASLRVFASGVLEAVGSVPGVEQVTASSDFPFRGRSSGSYIVRPEAPEELIRYHRHSVSPGYFETLGVELLAGRTFTAADDETARGVAVVTEAMVRRVFPELPRVASAVGRSVFIGPPEDPENQAEIVGVVENVRYRNLTQDMMATPNSPDVFFSLRQVPTRTHEVSFRTRRDPAEVFAAVREALATVDPEVPLYLPAALGDAYRAQTATPRFAALLMGLFSALAVLLACVGIYGILAFTVGQRAQEIAVRRALGAQAGTVAGSVIREGLTFAAAGILLGGCGAWWASGLLEDFLYQVRPADPGTYVAVAVTVLAVVLAAAAIPAWRATRRDPVEALTGA